MIIIDVGSCMAEYLRDRAVKQGFFFPDFRKFQAYWTNYFRYQGIDEFALDSSSLLNSLFSVSRDIHVGGYSFVSANSSTPI